MEDQESYERLVRAQNGTLSLKEQLRVPKINKAWIKERMVLPDQFLGACTLKEGTFVTILFLQFVAVSFTVYLYLSITIWRKEGDVFWERKFMDDFDPFYDKEPYILKRVKTLSNLWYDMAVALAKVHIAYFGTGLGVCFGLCYNRCHPFIYLPWILFTGFMLTACYFAILVMFFWLFFMRRNISVTWDIVPMVCVILYAIGWTYGYFIVIAHYKRRRIVQFWRKNKRKEFGGN